MTLRNLNIIVLTLLLTVALNAQDGDSIYKYNGTLKIKLHGRQSVKFRRTTNKGCTEDSCNYIQVKILDFRSRKVSGVTIHLWEDSVSLLRGKRIEGESYYVTNGPVNLGEKNTYRFHKLTNGRYDLYLDGRFEYYGAIRVSKLILENSSAKLTFYLGIPATTKDTVITSRNLLSDRQLKFKIKKMERQLNRKIRKQGPTGSY